MVNALKKIKEDFLSKAHLIHKIIYLKINGMLIFNVLCLMFYTNYNKNFLLYKKGKKNSINLLVAFDCKNRKINKILQKL